MSKNRNKSARIHIDKQGVVHQLSKEVSTGKFFIKNTQIEVAVSMTKIPINKGANKKKSNYDFSKPSQAQDLGDEWDHYAWCADDY